MKLFSKSMREKNLIHYKKIGKRTETNGKNFFGIISYVSMQLEYQINPKWRLSNRGHQDLFDKLH